VPSNDPDCQVLYATVSDNDEKIGFAIGKKILKDKDFISEIKVFKRNSKKKFKLEYSRVFPWHDASPRFIFNKFRDTELLFFSKRYIFEINYIEEDPNIRNIFYKIWNVMDLQPTLGCFTED